MGLLVIPEQRHEFMRHAYTALLNGTVSEFPVEFQQALVTEVTADLTGVLRNLCGPPSALTHLRRELLSATRPN